MNAYHVWIISGRDANAWLKGKRTGLKNRPWLVGTFATQAEANACKLGITAAIQGAIRNAVFLGHEEAKELDREVVARLNVARAALNLPPIQS